MNEVVLDVGCGENKVAGAIGIDMRPCRGVDLVCKFDEGLPFMDKSADKIWCTHVLEHMENLESILMEFKRILKDSGTIHIVVPHFSNSLAYSDYTHRRFFGYYTFDYFSRKKSKYWWVPSYIPDENLLSIERKQLVFKNFNVLRKLMDWIVNRSEFTAYLYEAKFSWVIPCFEIYFCLSKRATDR
jgi:ubiquinone/menaquinone biosynthesis C-methylase UbiE